MPSEPIYGFLDGFLRGLRHPVVIELGAHIGTDTLWMTERMRRPYSYLAVEPDPRSFTRLERAVRDLPLWLAPVAVGAVDGEAPFFLSGGRKDRSSLVHTDSSSLKRPDGIYQRYPWMKFTEISVQVSALDSLTANLGINRVDFLWADIQGAELDMLRGGQKTLLSTRFFYTECYARTRLYRGQPTLEQIEREMPGTWRMVFRTATDVLFENLSL